MKMYLWFLLWIGVLVFQGARDARLTACAEARPGQMVSIICRETQPIVDVVIRKRIVAVADSLKSTLTLIPGADTIWVCAPHDNGKSCKDLREVTAWILANGTE